MRSLAIALGLVSALGLSSCSDEPSASPSGPATPSTSGAGRGAPEAAAPTYAGGEPLADGLTTVPGSRREGPIGRTGSGAASAWYATLLLAEGTSAATVIDGLVGQATRLGYESVKKQPTIVRLRGTGPDASTRTLDLSGADAASGAPGRVSIIVLTTGGSR